MANLGEGEIGYVDRAAGRFESLAFCPGYIRGIAFHGDFAVVGLSKQRRERAFSGLGLDGRLREKDSDARCGLWVIDLRSGVVTHWLQIEGAVIELYDVAVLPGVRRPMALGFQSDEIQRLLTIGETPRPRFEALHLSAAARPSPRAAAPPAGAAVSATAASAEVGPAEPEYRLGNQLAKAEHHGEAIAHYEAALRAAPNHINARVNLGTAHHRLGDAVAALQCYRRALEIDSKSVRAHANLARVVRELGEVEQAIRHWEAARRLHPDNTVILRELGSLLCNAGQWRGARRCLEAVVAAEPDSAAGYNGLGAMCLLEDKADEAVPLFERALQLDPGLREAHFNLGNVYEGRGAIGEARQAFARALTIRDDPVLALHRELLCPPILDSVEQRDEYRQRAESVLDLFSGRDLRLALAEVPTSRAEVPFNWSYYGGDDLALRRKYAGLFEPSLPLEPLGRRPSASGPWRVGFAVTASHEGVFLRCMGGIVDGLERRRFRPLVACTRPGIDRIRKSLRNPETDFLELPHQFDNAVEALRGQRLDLIYFWEVGTDSTNYFMAFLRFAPIQCTGWGWPISSGAPEIDYHVTSEALAPDGADRFFREPLHRLPHLPAYALPLRQQPPVSPPEQFGLAEHANIYLCAQNIRKVHPDFDEALGGILRADRRAVAVFVHDKSPLLGAALQQRWRRTLADIADRLVILPRLTPDDYICLVASATVILDTPYFGGSNTVYDTSAVGVPVVTLPGETPASRYTAALHRSMGIDDGELPAPSRIISIGPFGWARTAVRVIPSRLVSAPRTRRSSKTVAPSNSSRRSSLPC